MTDVLLEAHELINNSRAKDHGDFKELFNRIALYWEIHLQSKGVAAQLDAWDVAMMMQDVKRARSLSNRGHVDNYRDGPGYWGLAFGVKDDRKD